MKHLIITPITILLVIGHVFCQSTEPIVREWNAFYQTVNIKGFRGGNFRITASIKADTMSVKSSAHLWARVDQSDGKMGYFNNMLDQPIKQNKWKSYTIEGPISKKADSLVFGGLYFNRGKYYYNDFQLMIKSKDSEVWVSVEFKNSNFENKRKYKVWKEFTKVIGFELVTNKTDIHNKNNSLIIDGSQNYSYGNNDINGNYASINGIKLYYEIYGQGEPLLLLHGNSQSVKDFNKQIPELAKYFRVIAVDTRGQGNSTENGEKLSYELFAKDILGLLNHLKLDSVNLLGWSDGGNIGLILAMNNQSKVKKLAVMGAVLYNKNTSVKSKVNSTLQKRLQELSDQNPENTFEKRMIQLLINEPNINPKDLNKINCPTLVMAGSNDLIKEGHTKLIANNIAKSKLMIFEKGTHYEPIEKPKRFNETIMKFFNSRITTYNN